MKFIQADEPCNLRMKAEGAEAHGLEKRFIERCRLVELEIIDE